MKQHTYTVAFKIRAVRFLRSNNDNVKKTARQFNVDPKRIREWRSNYSKLVCKSRGEDKNRQSLHLGKAPLSEHMDAAVYKYFEAERSEGRPVSNKDLCEEALKVATSKGILNFKASDGWLRNWKRRFSVSLGQGTNSSQCAVKELRENYESDMDSSVHYESDESASPVQNGTNSDNTCSTCNKSFKTRFALTQHNKTHYVEKMYACSSCNKRFATKGCLEIHELSHSSDICKLCGNSFSHPSGSRNAKNLCDTCSGYSSSNEISVGEQQLSSTEEEFFANQQSSDSAARRERRVYVSEQQKRKLVQFMEDNPALVRNQLKPSFTAKDRKRLWEELKVILNGDSDGRIKNVAQWKKCWNDLKSSVRERAAKLKADKGPVNVWPLSDIDERIFSLTEIPSSKDQVKKREPSRREGLRNLSLRVELPKIEAAEDYILGTKEPGSPNYDVESPMEEESNVIKNEEPAGIASTSVDPPVLNGSSVSSSRNNSAIPNGIRKRKITFRMSELKEAKEAVISLAETNKETLNAFKRIATAQEQMVVLQTKRNNEQRQFENKLLLMVEGLLTHVQNK